MRRPLHVLHRWAGLIAGPLLLLQALTGLAWTFQEPMTALLHPEARVPGGPRAPLDDVLAAIVGRYPGGELDRIQFPRDETLALTARVKVHGATYLVLVHPSTTRVLSSGPLWAFPEQLAERLHGALLLGRTGHVILQVEGLALALMAGSGLVLWWPRLASKGQAFAIHIRAPLPRLVREIHQAVGAVAAVFLVVVGTTGALMASESLTKALIAGVAPVAPDIDLRLPPTPAGAPLISAREALEALQARFPNGRLVKARTQGAEDRAVVAVFVELSAGNPMAYDMAGMDRATGAVTILAEARRQPSGDAIMAWLAPVHTGAIIGPLWWPFAVGLALALIGMALTGLTLWLIRQRGAPGARKPSK